MAENYIYAVARIRSRELSLLNESVISQLTACPARRNVSGSSVKKAGGIPGCPARRCSGASRKKPGL